MIYCFREVSIKTIKYTDVIRLFTIIYDFRNSCRNKTLNIDQRVGANGLGNFRFHWSKLRFTKNRGKVKTINYNKFDFFDKLERYEITRRLLQTYAILLYIIIHNIIFMHVYRI